MSQNLRIGHGYDVHCLIEGRDLILGGVTIPHSKGLDGHSDADSLTHAVADAILGAASLPDIGTYFSNTDPANKDMDSQIILRNAKSEACIHGLRIVNIDCTVIAQEPKIASYIGQMKIILGRTLDIPTTCIGIKATTHEGLGSLGRGAGIAAHAVVLLTGQE